MPPEVQGALMDQFTLLPVAPFPWWQPPETVHMQLCSMDKHQLMPSTQKARRSKTTQQARAGSRGVTGEGRSERSSAVWPEDLGQTPGPGSEGRCSRDRFIFSCGDRTVLGPGQQTRLQMPSVEWQPRNNVGN